MQKEEGKFFKSWLLIVLEKGEKYKRILASGAVAWAHPAKGRIDPPRRGWPISGESKNRGTLFLRKKHAGKRLEDFT